MPPQTESFYGKFLNQSMFNGWWTDLYLFVFIVNIYIYIFLCWNKLDWWFLVLHLEFMWTWMYLSVMCAHFIWYMSLFIWSENCFIFQLKWNRIVLTIFFVFRNINKIVKIIIFRIILQEFNLPRNIQESPGIVYLCVCVCVAQKSFRKNI